MRLDEIKARLNEVGSHHPDVVVLVAAVEAVLALHEPVGGPSDPRCCPVCVDLSGEYAETYPCATATAILVALGEE